MTETPEINVELLKAVLEGLAQPATLNDHSLVNSRFVQDYLSQQPEAQRLPVGRALGWALAELWRQRFRPPARAAKLKRQWNMFLVLEVGFFFPFRHGKRLPTGLPQIGALLADRDHLALVLAEGDEQQAEVLLKEEAPEFWEMLTPSNKKDALVMGASAVLARRAAALRELAKVLLEIEAVPNEVERPSSNLSGTTHGEVSADSSAGDDAMGLYLSTCLPARPLYLPAEWQSLIPMITSTPQVIIQGRTGSGKTTLLHALAHEFRQAGCIPLVVRLTEYAPLAKEMDVLHFTATRGPFGLACRDEVRRAAFEQALAAADQAGRLVILADQGDDVFECERLDLVRRLDRFHRLILTECAPRLMIKREPAAVVRLPDLSSTSLLEVLLTVNVSQAKATKIMEEFERYAVRLTPALALHASQTLSETGGHPVLVLSHWIDWKLKATRLTGMLVGEVDKARRLLRYLAGIRYDIALHPEPTTRLTRENVRRAFWSLPLQVEEEDQGWQLIDLCCRAGLLNQAKEDWIFYHADVERSLAAEYASEEISWVSLQPKHRALMKWTSALVAWRGTAQRRALFLEQLRTALNSASPLSTLDAAEFIADFNPSGTSEAEALKNELSQALKRLMQSTSSQVRSEATRRWQFLQGEAGATDDSDPEVNIDHLKSLKAKAIDLVGLLRQLDMPQPTSNEDRWLNDRRVLNALLDGMSQAASTKVKQQCAAWLQQADLSKVVEIDVHAKAPWKSRGRSALEMVAAFALDVDQSVDTRVLARDVLATDDALLSLWELGDEYTAVVYELLLALDKRLVLVPTPPGRHEWRMVA